MPEGAELTIAEIVDWYLSYLRELKKPVSATQTGNLSRSKEGLGSKLAFRLTAADVIEQTNDRRTGRHRDKRGILIPACGGATNRRLRSRNRKTRKRDHQA